MLIHFSTFDFGMRCFGVVLLELNVHFTSKLLFRLFNTLLRSCLGEDNFFLTITSI